MIRSGGFFALLFTLLSVQAQVQSSDIRFEHELMELGEIESNYGDVPVSFKFFNHSSDTFVISEITVACGCTRESRFQRVIPGGDSGAITVTLNPQGMIGKANKWIQVQGNFSDIPYKELRFHANVTDKRAMRDVIDQSYYPGQYGYVLIMNPTIHLGEQLRGSVIRDSVEVLNDGNKPYQVLEAKGLPSFIRVLNLPMQIDGKASDFIQFEIDTRDLDTVGAMSGSFKLLTDDYTLKTKEIHYSLYLKQDFSKMGWWALRKAPRVEVSRNVIDMGNMNSGQVRVKTVTIRNTGKRPLRFLRVESDCSCAILQDLPNELKAGEEIEVQVRFDSVFKKGNYRKVIALYTNDPKNEKLELFVAAHVN